MKRIILSASALMALLVATAAQADSVNGASASGTAAVTIFTPLAIVQNTGLDFGTLSSGATPGAVAIGANNYLRAVSGGVGAIAVNNGKPATFTVTGQANAAINVVIALNMTGFSGGITGQTNTGTVPLPTVLTGTTASFNIGGYLAIPANTPPGVYAGSFAVSVNYP